MRTSTKSDGVRPSGLARARYSGQAFFALMSAIHLETRRAVIGRVLSQDLRFDLLQSSSRTFFGRQNLADVFVNVRVVVNHQDPISFMGLHQTLSWILPGAWRIFTANIALRFGPAIRTVHDPTGWGAASL
jgi:hypothetical protein